MQLTPWYGTDPLVSLDGPPADIAEPVIRQRRRLAAALASFTDDQWTNPSCCEGWSSRDVVVHLDSTNAFWAYSITQGLRGEPTEFLATFDPVSSPAEMVAGAVALSAGEALERFVVSTEALITVLEGLDDKGWSTLAEAPPGHVAISTVAHHALWDSWVHERDILLPLGIVPDVEADEVTACLRYGAALSPSFALSRGREPRGVLAVAVTDPDVGFVVEVGDRVAVRDGPADADVELTGDAIELLEAISIRRPFAQQVPDEWAWMVSGVAETFDVPAVSRSASGSRR